MDSKLADAVDSLRITELDSSDNLEFSEPSFPQLSYNQESVRDSPGVEAENGADNEAEKPGPDSLKHEKIVEAANGSQHTRTSSILDDVNNKLSESLFKQEASLDELPPCEGSAPFAKETMNARELSPPGGSSSKAPELFSRPQSRDHSCSPTSLRQNDSPAVSLLSSHAERETSSPLDNVKELLSNSRNSSFSLPRQHSHEDPPFHKRRGILSFKNGRDSGSDSDSDDALEPADNSFKGMRRKQNMTRRLETENMELRLKLQQYREMNASEQEITRAKRQLARSERRIDELELALQRKNQTIRDLCAERDSAIEVVNSERTKELYDTIAELQAAITQLEEESKEVRNLERDLVAQANKEMPETVIANAQVKDLLDAIRQLKREKSELSNLLNASSHISEEYSMVKKLLTDAGRRGNTLTMVRDLLSELAEEKEKSVAMQGTLDNEVHSLRKDNVKLQDRLRSLRQELDESRSELRASASNSLGHRRKLEAKVENLEKLLVDSRSTSYSIIRQLFMELFEVMGSDFQEKVERQLEDIMSRAKREGLSKIPLLTDLLVSHAREIGEAAIRPQSSKVDERKTWMLEREIQSLEHILDLKWDKAGADSVLRAQVRDLRKQLRFEEEKRKSEWMEYQHSVQKLRQ